MFDTISQDVRHAFRMLRKNPGFSAIAVLSIAIGVGANAALFSVADGLLLRPLAVPDAGDILVIGVRTPTGQLRNRGISYPDYRDLRDRMTAFDGLAAYRTIVVSYAPRREDVAQGKYGYAVSGNLF